MKRAGKEKSAYLRRCEMLLNFIDQSAPDSAVRWGSDLLGHWSDLEVKWRICYGRVALQFRCGSVRAAGFISSIQPMSGGVRIRLRQLQHLIPQSMDVLWDHGTSTCSVRAEEVWKAVAPWLKERFPGSRVVSVTSRPDLSRTLSGAFLRIVVRSRHGIGLAIVCLQPGGEMGPKSLTQLLLWARNLRKRIEKISGLCIVVESRHSAILVHRSRLIPQGPFGPVEIWDYESESPGPWQIRLAPPPKPAVENKDFRWPVLGPFRWNSLLERTVNLAPGLINRYPRFQTYDSLRILGLEFAHAYGPQRERIVFGIGEQSRELTEESFPELERLVEEIVYYRRADSPDTRHSYYRLQPERWMESLIIEGAGSIFPEIHPGSIYSQIPVYLGDERGRADILATDLQGTLVVMELKVAPDPDLPLQALDYWARVVRHNQNGDFERRGYFSEIRLRRTSPKLFLVAPVFSFHDSTEQILTYLARGLVEIWKIAVNEDWRCGIRVLSRKRL